MFNGNGNITESTVSNIFFITSKNEVITPPVSDGVLPGIVREKVILICNSLDIRCFERSINLSDIRTFTAGFLTNSVFGIKKINLIDNIQLSSTNAIINQINKSYIQLIN